MSEELQQGPVIIPLSAYNVGFGCGCQCRSRTKQWCVYEVREINDANISIDKTITIYKLEPTADTAYTFETPADTNGQVCVFWLWIKMGATAHEIAFPASVEWLCEPSLDANSETLLVFMSVDDGATWTANVQWEKVAS